MKTRTARWPKNEQCKKCHEWRQLSYGPNYPRYRKCDCGFYQFDSFFQMWVWICGPEVEG